MRSPGHGAIPTPEIDARRHAPATARNAAPILIILRDALPAAGLVLEVASGTGEHVVQFGRALPMLEWQPSDPSPDARASIDAWKAGERLANVRAALPLDARAEEWPVERADALICINMIHISPWAAARGLMRGAARVLTAGAPLILYGPFHVPGRPLAAGNAAFDRSLRESDPAWGLRDLDEVTACASAAGLKRARVVDMPADNLAILFRRTSN